MLRKDSVDTALLNLTQDLCKKKELQKFILVGGTALSLQIGHRKSIDIDLFSTSSFDVAEMIFFLQTEYNYTIQNRDKNTLIGAIGDIKVDFLSHQYKWLQPPVISDNIRLASLQDLAAMKLNAIVSNGTRLKDYIDLAFLSIRFSLAEMLQFFEEKYPNNNSMMAMKSLNWLEDINFDVDIVYISKKLLWNEVKSRIVDMIRYPQDKFQEF